MKKILEKMLTNVAGKEGATYGVRVDDGREEGRNSEKSFWTSALKIAKKGKVERSTLRQIGNQIWETTGWSNPVDSVSVFAHMVKNQAQDVVVEEKRKRDDDSKKKDEDFPDLQRGKQDRAGRRKKSQSRCRRS